MEINVNSYQEFNNRNCYLDKLPHMIGVETVLGCNLKCKMCPVSNKDTGISKRPVCHMPQEIFSKILTDISGEKHHVGLTLNGEPLLNRNIVDYIKQAKSHGHAVSLTSNGSMLTEELSIGILEAGLDSISFSFDGNEKSTYEAIRINSDFDKTRKNIIDFCALSKKHGKCSSRVDYIVSDLTVSEIEGARVFWQQYLPIGFINLDDFGGHLKIPDEFGKIRTNRRETHRYPCDLLWTTMDISAEGYVTYCCHDYNLRSELPNIKDESLTNVWRNIIVKEREKHMRGCVDKEPCSNCLAWKTRPEFY
jgi:MoaA/NifB/PqqE/SkfB family radical SAM enzyme